MAGLPGIIVSIRKSPITPIATVQNWDNIVVRNRLFTGIELGLIGVGWHNDHGRLVLKKDIGAATASRIRVGINVSVT
jgi:hypothetical protein